ncbi:MAG: MFS transporter [Candidatus Aenigmatarchaeota archaeon]
MPFEKRKLDNITRSVLVEGRIDSKKIKSNNAKKEQTKIEKKNIDKKIHKSLQYSITEGVFNTASSSITESYITPFALMLRASNLDIGLLFSIRNFANTIAQIPGAKLTEFFDRKFIWFFSQIISRIIIWIPIILLPFIPLKNPITLLILLFAIAGFFSALRSPAWSSLMGDLVPMKIRGRYFGWRNTINGIAGVVATLAAGFLLSYYGFPLIFIIAIILAAISIPLFLKIYEPPFKKIYHYKHRFEFNPRYWPNTLRVNRSLAIFTVYIFFMYLAVEIASPFYAVYMLRELKIDYIWFGILTVIGAVARILSFKYWGKLNDKFGSRKILIVCGFFGIFTPFGWMLVFDIFTIAILKVFDGFIWSGFDMVVFNYLLDITPAEKRPQYVANFNFFIGIGVILGSVIGGILAESWSNTTFLWLHGLQIIFLLSFLLRLACLLLLPKLGEVVIRHSDIPIRYVFWYAIAVEPARNIMHAISYTFRYPYEIEKKFKKEIDKLKFKIKAMEN